MPFRRHRTSARAGYVPARIEPRRLEPDIGRERWYRSRGSTRHVLDGDPRASFAMKDSSELGHASALQAKQNRSVGEHRERHLVAGPHAELVTNSLRDRRLTLAGECRNRIRSEEHTSELQSP